MHRSPVVPTGLKLLVESAGDSCQVYDRDPAGPVDTILDETHPDVVLVDPEFPQVKLGEVTRAASRRSEVTAVAVISGAEDPEYVDAAVESSAHGFVSLHSTPEEFVSSLRLLAEGHMVVTGSEVETLADLAAGESPHGRADSQTGELTPREAEIAALVATGLINRDLADRLGLAEGTVKVHLRNMFRKLGMSSRAELAAYAQRVGIVR